MATEQPAAEQRMLSLFSGEGTSLTRWLVAPKQVDAFKRHFKCMQLGLNANVFLDSQMQVMSAAALTLEDVGIGISHSGMQRHVAEALELAGSGGATTVALRAIQARRWP